MSIITSYPTSAATSPYPKMGKSLFNRYFSFSNKVFYPIACIMNGLQHLTTPKSLKICLALCYLSGPNSSKFGPSCPQVGSNFFCLVKETTFLEPVRTLNFSPFLKCFLSFKMSFSTFESQLHCTLQNFSIDLIEVSAFPTVFTMFLENFTSFS